MKHIRKLSLVLAAVLCTGMLSGCESSKIGDYAATEVAKYGKESIMLDEANFWLRYQQMENENTYGWFYTAYYGVENIWTMDISGNGTQTMGDNLHKAVMTQLWQTRVLADHAGDYNISLTDAQKEKIAETAASIRETYPGLSEYADVTDAKIQGWLEQNAIANLVAQAVKDAAEIVISDEEVQAYGIEYITVTKPAESEAEETTAAEAEETTAAEAGETTAEAEETTAAEAEETTAEAEETTAAEAEETTAEAEETTAAEAEETTAESEETTAEEAEDVVDLEEAEEEPALEGEELANAVLALAQEGTEFDEIEEQLGVSHYDTSYLLTGETSTDVKYTTTAEMAAGEVQMIAEDNSWTIVKRVNDLDEDETEERRENLLEERQNLAFNDKYAEWQTASPKFTVNEKIWSQILVDEMIYEAPTEEETEEAEETEALTEEAEAEGAETEAAETEAAETKAAETEAAETEAAETKAAETEAAETETAETEAAETTAEAK